MKHEPPTPAGPTPQADDDRRRIIAQVQGTVDAWRDNTLTAEQAMTLIEHIVMPGGAS